MYSYILTSHSSFLKSLALALSPVIALFVLFYQGYKLGIF